MDISDLPPLPGPELLQLERYLTGVLLPGEREAVEQWLAAHPERAREVELHRRIAETTAALRPQPAGTDAAWARMDSALRAGRLPHLRPRGVGGYSALSAAWSGAGGWHRAVAAVVAAVFTLAAGAVLARLGRGSTSGSAIQKYVTATGQRLTVALSDGTQFTLAPASTLRVAPDYGRARRDVELDGEAYFVVRHDLAHPFTVHARGAVARDVGTRFDVRAYADGQPARVAVADGAVAVGVGGAIEGQAGRVVMLHAGDVATVSEGQTAIVARGVDTTAYLGWTNGRLVFDGTPLRDALTELGRWYGLDFHLGDASLARERLHMTVQGASRDELLDGLVLLLNARYERQGTHVMIYRRQRSK